jgi:hypothetical protein
VQVNVVVHPHVPPASTAEGWRWAVVIGHGPIFDPDRTAHAGWDLDRDAAIREGDACGATACVALRIAGLPATWCGQPTVLDYDPVPPGHNKVRVL